MPFETSFPFTWDLLCGAISAEVREVGGTAPLSLIRADQELDIHVRWTLAGELTEYVCGCWQVQTYLESIGPGVELPLPEPALAVGMVPAPAPNSYSAVVGIPAGATIMGADVTPFKLGTVMTYRTPLGSPEPIAGFVEGPTVLIYAS